MKILVFLVVGTMSSCFATIPRPRGVAISMASFYQPGKTFRCLDGSKEVPFEYVNDDYCDCPDGTDEPGTSACPGGKFHCTNAGYKPQNILSSRVNDGICDCCDGTDEYNGNIDCVNNCKELGKKMREEADRTRQLQEQGHKQKLQFSEEGKKTRAEKKAQLEQLEKTKIEMEAVKNEMEAKKTDAEEPEKAAKEKHENAWKEVQEQRKKEKEEQEAKNAFVELDANKNNLIDVEEIRKYSQFDIDSNGEVSVDEAKEHLESEEQVDLEIFIQKVWPNIKEVYKRGGEEEETKGEDQPADPQPPATEDEDDDDDEDEYDDEDEEEDELEDDFDGEEHTEHVDNATNQDEEEKMPDYDEETKALIAAADEARNQFNEAERKFKDTENEINTISKYLGLDFGPEEEFSVLQGNCYEYTDREYTYKLCGYDRASQRSKSGGSETSLGSWGKWDGSAEDKYSAQKYDNGQNCWNGPNRSVRVVFKCGLENKLVNAFEPSRCEYEFDFETPARCTALKPSSNEDYHDEL